MRWLREVRLTSMLMEFFLSCGIVMVLCVIYQTLLPVEEEDAGVVLGVTSYAVYIMLVAYVVLFLSTLGKAFPDMYLVKVFKAVLKKVNLFKSLGMDKELSEDTFNDLKDLADEESGDRKKKDSTT